MTPPKKENYIKNPFPGLRPYNPEESLLFFGRDNESREILRKLLDNRFVAVTGASGSGKSSLIQCGVLSEIRRLSSGKQPDWSIISFRPGNEPLFSLATALQGFMSARGTYKHTVEEIFKILRDDTVAVADLLKTPSGDSHGKMLIVVDQFEDLFRMNHTVENLKAEQERETLIRFLSDIATGPENDIYVIIAMRSDLISECSQFKEFTNLINKSNYLVPRMTHDNYREVIESPLRAVGVTIEPGLVDVILGDLDDSSESLPVLQHALMRTYSMWAELEQPQRPIGLTDYNSAGTLGNAMSQHADELFGKLTVEEKRICEGVFKNIAGKGPDNRGIRRPARISDLAQIIQSPEENLIKVIDNFRDNEGSFITPHKNLILGSDSYVDLSHESLINLWPRLNTWVEEEDASVMMYLRLSELSAMFQQGRTGLMKNPDLQTAVNWRNSNNPTLAWARKYDPAFERAMVYLRTSEKTFIEAEEQRKNLQKARIRRIKIFSRILGSIAFIAGLFMIIAFLQKSIAENKRIIAESESMEARQQRIVAEKNAATATQRLTEVDSIALAARRNEIAALQMTEITERRRRDAERVAEVARREQAAALALKDETQKMRMVSVAKSMSLRSLRMPGRKDLQSLLAYQAYLFNKRNNGHYNDADIYAGLYNIAKEYGNINYRKFSGHEGEIRSLAFVPGRSEFFTSGSDGRVIKWDLGRHEQNLQVIYSDSDIYDVIAVSRDADWLACGGTGPDIRMIPVRGNEPGYELKGHSGKVSSLIFSYDGNYLYSAALDGKVMKWDLSARTSVDVSTGEIAVTSIELSGDNRFLAGLSKNGEALVWNPDDRSEKINIRTEGKVISSLRFKPEENILGVGYSDGVVELWDVMERKRISTITAHNAGINNIRFNGRMAQMATTDSDGTIKIWDTEDYDCPPLNFDDNEGLIVAIDFSPDGQFILSGSLGRVDNLVGRPTLADSLVTGVCSGVSRNFTPGEWIAYVGRDIEYEETCREAEYQIRINRVRN